jgi:hypothetical protein
VHLKKNFLFFLAQFLLSYVKKSFQVSVIRVKNLVFLEELETYIYFVIRKTLFRLAVLVQITGALQVRQVPTSQYEVSRYTPHDGVGWPTVTHHFFKPRDELFVFQIEGH